MAFLKESVKIPFRDIQEATKNFTTIIGRGGYGPVYKGELSLSGVLTTVAVKRLLNIAESGQGLKEFLTEIHLLSRYKHPNVVSLLGFCEEGVEKILIYEYAERGSFDKYLETTCSLTWKQRINICIDAARGLDFLHNHVGVNHRIIHRDIKSANILLDDKWRAKISDLGLSKIGRANEKETYIITNGAGTFGYCDPVYIKTGILTKKSDVYSFGVVLFEALCGRLNFKNVHGPARLLVRLAKRCYKEGKLNEIMDLDLKNSISVNEFSDIAYQCLHRDQEGRPSMDYVLQKLEITLDLEETYELREFVEALVLNEVSEAMELQAMEAMQGGILVDDGKVWLSIDENGQSQEMISSMKFMSPDSSKWEAFSCEEFSWSSLYRGTITSSAFPMVAKIVDPSKVNMDLKIRTQFLSSNVSYAAYLVCLIKDSFGRMIRHSLTYKLNNQSMSYVAHPRYYYDKINEWVMIELFQTSSLNKRSVEFKVLLESFHIKKDYYGSKVIVQGIVFLPIQKFDDEKIKTEEMEDPPTSEIALPSDYEQFIYHSGKKMEKHSQDCVITKTKEEAYTILSRGVYIKMEKYVDVWFWITKSNGKKCFMLSAESIYGYQKNQKLELSHPNESRFKYVLQIQSSLKSTLLFKIPSTLLSTNTSYACYLVYKMPPAGFDFHCPVEVETYRDILGLPDDYKNRSTFYNYWHVWLNGCKSQLVNGPGEGSLVPSAEIMNNKIPGAYPQPSKRKDGWLEVRLWDFTTYDEPSLLKLYPKWYSSKFDSWEGFPIVDADYDQNLRIYLSCDHTVIPKLILQGVEFRPL